MIDTGAGVIDADYRGEVKVLLFNHAKEDFQGPSPPPSPLPSVRPSRHSLPLSTTPTVNAGDRVAQLILERIVTPEPQEVASLADTVRGAGGFGSTGGFGARRRRRQRRSSVTRWPGRWRRLRRGRRRRRRRVRERAPALVQRGSCADERVDDSPRGYRALCRAPRVVVVASGWRCVCFSECTSRERGPGRSASTPWEIASPR